MNGDPALTGFVFLAFLIVGIVAAPVFFVIGWIIYTLITM